MRISANGSNIRWSFLHLFNLFLSLSLLSPCECEEFLVGGIASAYYATQFENGTRDEITSMLKLGVEMVNNKTDGWWDWETRNVYLTMMINHTAQLNYSSRSAQVANADTLVEYQVAWAENNGTNLVGVIGAATSAESMSIAAYSNYQILPQMSYASSASGLENFAFFARVCLSDDDVGPLLSYVIGPILNIKYLTLIYELGDVYSESIATSVTNSFNELGPEYSILETYPFSMNYQELMPQVIIAIEETGAPGVVVVGQSTFMGLFLSTFKNNCNDPDKYMIITTYEVHGDARKMIPRGMLSLHQVKPNTQLYTDFVQLWQSLDPNEYPSMFDDRTEMYSYSPNIIDSIFLLAMGLQNAGTESGTDSVYRKSVYDKMVDLKMEMISGDIEFDQYGDLALFLAGIFNFNGTSYNHVANISSNAGKLEYRLVGHTFVWPDGSTGPNQPSYSGQYTPYCRPGFQSTLTTDGLLACQACEQGYYKPYYGSQACTACPDGADCQYPGTQVPCLLPGYWRDVPPPGRMADLDTYKIYPCVYHGQCKGGCDLNYTCDSKQMQSSKLCAVCDDEFYSIAANCLKCQMQGDSSLAAFYIFCLVIVFLFVGLTAYVLRHIATQKKKDKKKGDMHVVVSTFICINFLQVLPSSTRNLDWQPTQHFVELLDTISYDPSNSIVSLNSFLKCAGVSHSIVTAIYCVILLPICLCTALLAVTFLMRTYYVRNAVIFEELRFKRNIFYCLVGIGFMTYIPCSVAALTIFSCQDLGSSGFWLRLDYAQECGGHAYSGLWVLGAIGCIFFIVGIPLFFSFILYKRKVSIFERASRLISAGYKQEYLYWEIQELIRKLLLTALVQFISSSSSRSLYLLVVDNVFLLRLVYAMPFIDPVDNICAILFYATECTVYLVALIDTASLDDMDGFNMTALYTLLFFLVIIMFAIVMPICILNKVPKVRNSVKEYYDGCWLADFIANIDDKVEKERLSRMSEIENPMVAVKAKGGFGRGSDVVGVLAGAGASGEGGELEMRVEVDGTISHS